MNNKERKELNHFPAGLDAAVNAKFPGAECNTSFNIFQMRHVTVWNEKLHPAKHRQIQLFIDAYLEGNKELASRLTSLQKN